jgi:flagellar biosynthesis/type III secretory pathway chaperone
MNAPNNRPTTPGYFTALNQLRNLIEEERSAILKQDGPKLNEISAAKLVPLREVEGLLGMLRQGREPENFGPQKEELTKLLLQCDQANRVNGALLHTYAARARRLLIPLAGDAAPGYGPRPFSGGGMSTSGMLRARA